MTDFDRFVLGSLAHWWPGLGVSACCNVVVEVLTSPDGSVIISRCGFCHAGNFAEDDPAELAAS